MANHREAAAKDKKKVNGLWIEMVWHWSWKSSFNQIIFLRVHVQIIHFSLLSVWNFFFPRFLSRIDLNDLFYHFLLIFIIHSHVNVFGKWTTSQCSHINQLYTYVYIYILYGYASSGQLLALYELVNCHHEHERLRQQNRLIQNEERFTRIKIKRMWIE